jgi:cell division septal protein FtsQ
MKEIRTKKTKINYKRLLVLILFLYVLFNAGFQLVKVPIKNIYIKNNIILTDQEIIEIAKLETYPASFTTLSSQIRKRLESNIYIKNAKVTKSLLTTVNIEITENKPIFLDKLKNKTILQDGRSVNVRFNVPTLINFTPDIVYEHLVKKISLVNDEVISRMSEIEYKPNEVDEERFLISMNDGNYVYLNIEKFESVNDYIIIMKKFKHMKGILYLDSGEYFQVIEN